MQYILIAIACLYVGFKLGRKYQDMQDLIVARRVAKLVDQRQQLAKERDDYDRWEQQDKRLRKRKEPELIEEEIV